MVRKSVIVWNDNAEPVQPQPIRLSVIQVAPPPSSTGIDLKDLNGGLPRYDEQAENRVNPGIMRKYRDNLSSRANSNGTYKVNL